jgi:hypothetical protein
LDYANQRYYSNQFGRFMTPDPYKASAGPRDPGSWNRFAYVQGDPVNGIDPQGTNLMGPDDSGSFCGEDWIFDASLSGPCATGFYYVGPAKINFRNDQAAAQLDDIVGQGLIDDWNFVNGNANQVQITLNGGLVLFVPILAGPHVAKPPSSGYWAYLSCFLTELAAINMKNYEVPGVSLWAIAQGLVTGAAWGPGVAVVGGVTITVDFFNKENQVAHDCAKSTGYTPWILQ